MKMTIEQAEKRLSEINGKSDPMLNAFYGGRVGFRKYTKRDNQRFDRELRGATESVKLREFIASEELKAQLKANPKPSLYYENVNQIEVGKRYNDCSFGLITVIKRNKYTVTIKTISGYTEPRQPHFIYKN